MHCSRNCCNPTHYEFGVTYFSLKDGDGDSNVSLSLVWLHAMPQGSVNPININTTVAEGTQSKVVGDVSKQAVLDAAVKDSNLYRLQCH